MQCLIQICTHFYYNLPLVQPNNDIFNLKDMVTSLPIILKTKRECIIIFLVEWDLSMFDYSSHEFILAWHWRQLVIKGSACGVLV